MRSRTIPGTMLGLLGTILCTAASLHGQSWLERVSATQAAQPHWMTPVATVTPRLEQEFRFDTVRQLTPTGSVINVDGGKGLELIPTSRTELLINLPPYLKHENPEKKDGWGDVSFVMKYRFYARPEKKGNAIVTAFLAGSVPTGQYKNGAASAVITPTLAGGKGWGWFDVQSTLAGTFPVDRVREIGHSILWNTAFQAHTLARLWPEVEINSTSWAGGSHDGKTQTFVTPGLVLGRFRIHHRIALVAGAGFQIATSHYHEYNHALAVTVRMPF